MGNTSWVNDFCGYRACRRIIAEVFQSLALNGSFWVKNAPGISFDIAKSA